MKSRALLPCLLAGLFATACASSGTTCAKPGDVVVAKRSHIEYNYGDDRAGIGSATARTPIYHLILQRADGTTKTCRVNPAVYEGAKEGEPLS